MNIHTGEKHHVSFSDHRILRFWKYLVGSPVAFPLQARIYHSICLMVMLVMAYNIPFSLLIGLHWLAAAACVLTVLQYYLFRLSRFGGKTDVSRTFTLLLFYIFFVYNYFSNSGINGSGMLSFASWAFIAMAITPPRQQWWAGAFIAVSVVMVMIYEYNYPDTVQNTYKSLEDRFIDIGSTILVFIFLSIITFTFVISNYTKERNTALQKANQLNLSNLRKDKLISLISHDFNAPLRNVKQYLKLWRDHELDHDKRELLEKELLRVTTDTQNLLLNLLSWSRNNLDNEEDIRLVPVVVSDTLIDTFNVYNGIASDKGLLLSTTISSDVVVSGDFERLEIVLRNLISNAIKFTSQGGTINVGATDRGDAWEISVTDNGVGVDAEKEALLFKQHLHPDLGTEREKGVGIGLTICGEFVAAMGGEIGFQRLHDLSVFYVRLPKAGLDSAA